jgi:hypothetical protein
MFLQSLLNAYESGILGTNCLHAPAALPLIDELGEAIAQITISNKRKKLYELSASRSTTLFEYFEYFKKLTKKDIEVKELTSEELRTILTSVLPDKETANFVTALQIAIAEGVFAKGGNDLEVLLARETQDVEVVVGALVKK